MRNFILIIRRFFNLILFIILEIVCIILIARTNTMQGNDIMNSANYVTGLVYQKQHDVLYYFGLKRMNDSLLAENMRLRARLAAVHSIDTLSDLSVERQIGTVDSLHRLQFASYTYRTARVINNSVTAANNYITINRGRNTGIEKGMAVLSGSGVIGKVVAVSENFSTVLSVLSVKQQVSAHLKDGTIGYVIWEGTRPDEMIMKDVPQQIKVQKGDSVLTTSYSFFPPDVLIGTVREIEVIKKNNMQRLHLKPATNFRKLQYVYVVDDKMHIERRQLEDSLNNQR